MDEKAQDVVIVEDTDDDIQSKMKQYRHIPEVIPTAAWFILVTEFCERFAYYGGSTPFQNYIQNGPGGDPPGALNKGQAVATGLQSFFTFFCYLTPMLGAIMADQYIGRFWTIIIFSSIYMLGWLVLTCSALPSSLEAGGAFPGFIVSLIIIGIGTGGIKGIVSAFCAGQYKTTNNYTKELKNGETVIVDYDLSIQHMYNWFYWAINVGALLGGIVCPFLEMSIGFYAAFLLPTCMFAVAIMVFISGYKKYTKHEPTQSVILTAWRVFSFAYRQSRLPENKALHYPHHFIDFAKHGDSKIPGSADWSNDVVCTWDDDFVDELKQTMMACKIFLPLSIYWVCYNQLSNNLLSQAGKMKRPPGLPNDVMNNFNPIALIVFIPITDLFFYPALRKLNINFASQKRITVGFMLASLSMVYTAVLQHYIYTDEQYIASQGSHANISVFWQIPCYFLLAFSEIFASITPMEFAYTHSPKSMKSFVSALSLWPNCFSALISLAISPSAHDPNMVWVYGGVAVAAFVCGCLYYKVFGHYDRIDEENKLKKQAQETNGTLPKITLVENIEQDFDLLEEKEAKYLD